MEIPTVLTTIEGEAIIINEADYTPMRYGPIIAYNPGRPTERRVERMDTPAEGSAIVEPMAAPTAHSEETPKLRKRKPRA